MTKSKGINKPKANWTPELESMLSEIYPNITAKQASDITGMSVSQIYVKAKQLGLSKSEEFKSSALSGRVMRGKQDPRMAGTRFKAGQTPWNKGAHFIAGGRSIETQFKKGRKPEEARNYQPIGSTRISKDGYLERKVSDDQSIYPAKRWKFEHRIVWEASNGEIPQGHMIVFKKGLFTNKAELLTVDRLECISRAENAKRNSIWSKSPEIARLYQLKGAITRQVNRIKKKAHHEQ